MKRAEVIYVFIVSLLVAGLISATNSDSFGSARIYLYLYWLVRIFIECGLFIAFRNLLETNGVLKNRVFRLFSVSFILSLIPFVLAITALDIVLGFPELGLDSTDQSTGFHVTEFLMELIYVADDHLFLCILLSLPRILPLLDEPMQSYSEIEGQTRTKQSSILPMLDPPLSGQLVRVEAQEHYVIINSTDEQRMVLGRFSDLVGTLPPSLGIKIHRSHWVTFDAVEKYFVENRNMKLRLTNGDIVPVSRRYRRTVAEHFNG